MDQAKSLMMQKQIMDNSKVISDYYKDFEGWVNEMNKKETIVKQYNQSKPSQPLVQSSNSTESKSPQSKEADTSTQPKSQGNKHLQRDKNSIKNYYDEWDKINPEEDLVDVDSSITINSSSNTAQALYQDKKTSSAKENMNISIVNNRSQFSLSVDNQIERLKNEANANFALKNYNKCIEIYTSAIKLITKPNEHTLLLINLHNNRGNAQLKVGNYKQGVTNFDNVLIIDKSNVKALYRRGVCFLNLNQLNNAYNDLHAAYCLAFDNEKETIQNTIDQVISLMNSAIKSEKRKMEEFIYKDNEHFIKVRINDINSSQLSTFEATTQSNASSNSNQSSTTIQIGKKEMKKEVMNKCDIQKFVYDMTKDNLTASSFKYAFRNLGSIEEKKDYLMQINPQSFLKIFQSDLDNTTFLDIIKCLKLLDSKRQIVEYLEGLKQVNRINIIIQLNQKKSRPDLLELFDMLEKSDLSSEIISLKDFYFK